MWSYWAFVVLWVVVCLVLLFALYLIIGATCVNPTSDEPRHRTKADLLRRLPHTNICVIFLPIQDLSAQVEHVVRHFRDLERRRRGCRQRQEQEQGEGQGQKQIDVVVKPGKWTSAEQGVFRVQSKKALRELLTYWNRAVRGSSLFANDSIPLVVQLYHPGPWEMRVTLVRRHNRLHVQHCIAWKLAPKSATANRIVQPAREVSSSVSTVFLAHIRHQVQRAVPRLRVGTVDVRTRYPPSQAHKEYQILEVNGGFGQSLLQNTQPNNPRLTLLDVGEWGGRTVIPTVTQYRWNLWQWIRRFQTEIRWVHKADRFQRLSDRVHQSMERSNGIPYGRTADQL